MTVESATYLGDLDPSYPADSDNVIEGDNHIRLLKTVLQATFPNLDAAVTAAPADLNSLTGRQTFINNFLQAATPIAADAIFGHNFSASAAPTAGDDDGDGYRAGSTWVWGAASRMWVCFAATTGTAVWREISFGVPKNNFLASAAPTITDDDSGGYAAGSRWRLTAGTLTWVCVDATTGAAVWRLEVPLVAKYQETQSSGTPGGTFSAGAWRTRTLNDEVFDDIGASVGTNQVTLPAGTYEVRASAPGYQCGRHVIRLQNVSDATTVAEGECAFSGEGYLVTNRSELLDRFTITASKVFELQHRCDDSQATNGFGVNNGFTTEVYSTVEFSRIA